MTTPRAARVETPPDTLRRAAAKVRELGEAATSDGWTTHDGTTVHEDDGGVAAHCSFAEDAAWIAALSPAIAEPLAAWLDAEAAESDLRAGSRLNPAITEPTEALALAHALLASPVPEPDGEGT